MDIGALVFDALEPVLAQYQRGADAFEILVAVREMDKALRTSTRDRLLASDAQGTILSDDRIRRGGTLTLPSTAVYRIDDWHASPVPGMTDLVLDRIAGDATQLIDVADTLPREDTVIIAGAEVAALVTRSVETEEIGRDGQRVVVSRILVAVPASIDISLGDRITVYGKSRVVNEVLADGLGMQKVLL